MNLIKEESMWYIGNDESPSLSHHGILGMKWGIRRYQNSDGSLTAAGKIRYGASDRKSGENSSKKRLSTSQKVAIGVGTALATKSVLDSISNYNTANAMLEGYAKIPITKLISSGTVQAGKVFAIGYLGTRGVTKAASVISESRKPDRNPDGSLTPKGKKNYYKQERNEYLNKAVDYDNEFSKTDTGKALKNALAKERKRYFDDNDDSREQAFSKAEEKYLRAEQRYSATKLSKEYTPEEFSLLATRGRDSTLSVNEAIKQIEDEWWIHAE